MGGRKPRDAVFEYGHMMAHLGTTTDLLLQFIAELRRTSPDDKVIYAYSILLTMALTHLSQDVNGGRKAARRALEDVRESIVAELRQNPCPSDGLMLIAR